MAVHPIILPCERVRQENCDVGDSLDYTARTCLKKPKDKIKQNV
jgi:hypothetical protein